MIQKPILSSLAILLSVLTAPAATELKGTPEELTAHLLTIPSIVAITGESEIRVPADKAQVTLEITTENKSLADALRLNHDMRTRVTSFLADNGIGSNQIHSARFASTQKHWPFSEKAKSHRIDHFMKVAVRDDREFQAVASAVDRWTEVQFVGFEMQHSDRESIKARAQGKALDNAAERKKLFEEKLGVKLAPRAFSEAKVTAGAGTPERAAYESFQRYRSTSGLDKTTNIPARAGGTDAEESDSPFGELVFTARVTVEYTVDRK